METGRRDRADARSAPPELRNTHVVYEVALADEAGKYSGEVTFKPRVTARFAFYTSETGALQAWATGGAVCQLSEATSELCALRQAHVYDLEESEPVTLRLGPVTGDSILLMAEIL